MLDEIYDLEDRGESPNTKQNPNDDFRGSRTRISFLRTPSQENERWDEAQKAAE